MFPENTVGNDNCKMNTSVTLWVLLKNIISFRINESRWKLGPVWNSKQNPQNKANIMVEFLRVVQATIVHLRGSVVYEAKYGEQFPQVHRFGALVESSSIITMM